MKKLFTILFSLTLFQINSTSQVLQKIKTSLICQELTTDTIDFRKNWVDGGYEDTLVNCLLVGAKRYFVARSKKILPEFSLEYYSNAEYSIFCIDSINSISNPLFETFSVISDPPILFDKFACYKWIKKKNSSNIYSEGLVLLSYDGRFRILDFGKIEVNEISKENEQLKIFYKKRNYYIDPLFFLNRDFSIWNYYLSEAKIMYIDF